jgi:hypothetical protein
MPRLGSTIVVLTIVALAGAAGCRSKAGVARQATAVPEQADLETYLAALDDNASELRGAGVVVPVPTAGSTATPGEADAEPALDEDVPVADEAGGDASSTTVEESAKRDTAIRREPRCDRVCDLAQMACELEARICDLAAEHSDEDRYARACTRAQAQCEAATEACRTCE